jgi:hypothetical protein
MTDVQAQILGHLRYIRSASERLRDDIREVKERLGMLVDSMRTVSARVARLSLRLDKIDGRLKSGWRLGATDI